MKLRNLISAALLVGVGSTALPAAALVYTQYPTNLPPNCRITMMTSPPPLDVRGDDAPGHSALYFVHCTAPELPSWMTW